MFFPKYYVIFERESIQMKGVINGHIRAQLGQHDCRVAKLAGGFPHSGGSLTVSDHRNY